MLLEVILCIVLPDEPTKLAPDGKNLKLKVDVNAVPLLLPNAIWFAAGSTNLNK